ncbi:MAG: SMC-Scp complex subunit ScpB [Gammaproteobacteria bacterium]|nr:SMC-Scp complex subunit ScpB [Gammaproteobacteria bacterium]
MSEITLKHILEAALLAAGRPLSLDDMRNLFPESDMPEAPVLRAALEDLANDYAGRGLEVAEVASGFRIQVRQTMERWISRLWEDRPPKYSRALLETLALIAYRQPITRGEIEDIRGVTVSTSIMKTLQEREWIRVVAHRDVPGRPAMYGTTREFLDYFNLKSLEDLPSLVELRDIDSINAELDFGPLEGGRRQAVAAFGDDTAIDMPMLPDDTDFRPVDVSLVQLQTPDTLH